MSEKIHNKKLITNAVIAVLVIGVVVGGYYYYKYDQTRAELGLTKVELSNTKTDLAQVQEKAATLQANLETEQYKNSLFSGQISELTGTIGQLDKLSKTDKELLQKYSKVYFLNEHYVPDGLTDLSADYVFEKDKKIQVHAKVFPFFEALMKAAKRDGHDLKVISGFRSFGEQSSLKQGYKFTYGTGANAFSADQGYSEHQLGTALDFTTAQLGTNYTAFGKTEAYKWMQNNAYRYGFILSYPESNAYYQFEPWHWRFVGTKLADRMHEEKQNFYDLTQPQIDAYLINIFD